MSSYRKELWINVKQPMDFINITPQVEECLQESGIKNGLVLIHAMQVTASVLIDVDEIGLRQDYEHWLEDLAPHDPITRYHHNRRGEANADAHLKRQVLGRGITLAATDGKLELGWWEQIFYIELDGLHGEYVLVKIIGDK
ncbi:MAG: YjbQ family protein [Dehalococcoidia bacterium]|nr:MAG: YjbQ family protein [Dehalococcoidia bacterium]